VHVSICSTHNISFLRNHGDITPGACDETSNTNIAEDPLPIVLISDVLLSNVSDRIRGLQRKCFPLKMRMGFLYYV
jgi:hypothetical protein